MISPWLRPFPEIVVWLAAAVTGICAWLATVFLRGKTRATLWSAGFVTAVIMVSGCIQCLRYPIPDLHAEWMTLPPREAFLELEVSQLEFSPAIDQEGRTRFEAGVLSSRYPTLPFSEIGEVSCLLWKPVGEAIPAEGTRLKARGVLYNRLLSPIPEVQYRHGEILEILSPDKKPEPNLRSSILERIAYTLALGAPEDSNFPNYIQSIVTGDKRYLNKYDLQQFKAAGVMHFLAISGFHLGIIALMAHTLLQIARIPRRWIGLFTVLVCSIYVWATGSPVSAQRALLMLAIFFTARFVQRKPELLSSIVTSAWIILLISPKQLLSPGYQLSFLIVTGLILHAAPMQRLLVGRVPGDPFLPRGMLPAYRKWLEPVRFYVVASFSVSWTAFWVGLPVICCYFGNAPFIAIILNTLLAPLFALVLVAGVISIGFGFLHLFVISEFINHSVWVLMSLIIRIIDTSTWFPWLLWKKEGNATVALWTVGIMLALMLGFDASRKRNRWIYAVLPLLSISSVLMQDWVASLVK